MSGCSPLKLSRGVSFLLAYGTNLSIIISALDRLFTVKTQLSKMDCVFLSRGVEIMMELSKKKQIPGGAYDVFLFKGYNSEGSKIIIGIKKIPLYVVMNGRLQ